MPLQVVNTKLTRHTRPFRSAIFRALPSWVVSVKSGAGWMTANRDVGVAAITAISASDHIVLLDKYSQNMSYKTYRPYRSYRFSV